MLSSTITQKGQITIPKKIRETLNLKPNDQVVFVRRGDSIIIKPIRDILSVKGVVPQRKSKNYSEIREKVKNEITKRVADV